MFIALIGFTISDSIPKNKSMTFINNSTWNYTNRNVTNRKFNLTRRTGHKWLFKDYLMKYNPNVVFNRIKERKKALGRNATVKDDFDEIFEGIDFTDDLLRLNVSATSGRRSKWTPPGVPNVGTARDRDIFYLRQRFFELIRHCIYQTRNRIVIMQILRKKYRSSPLYKMGFLTSKIDVAVKSFHQFAYRVIHACPGRDYGYSDRFEVISMMHAEEKLNNKMFEIELLIDLITKNHENALQVIEKNYNERKEKWTFID